ncbi:MAG TPA: hypothetical protein VKX45_08685 [Bryobacteraceae bacterium]|jgi:hypothetical protein|nr:hypothetical protein [Bryobacteraceae bacterium]
MARVLHLAAGAAFSAALVFAQNPPDSQGVKTPTSRKTPSVGVFLDFDTAPGTVPMEMMKKEVDKILKPAGVALDWRLASENRGDQAFSGLVVLKFKGKCRIESWGETGSEPQPGEAMTLGATKVVNGRVLPFTEVECDQVKRALAYLPPQAGAKERQKAFGIALGRVVAHELYHILARTTAHAGHGLARASESLEDLVSQRSMGFRDEESTAIRKGLLPR